MDAKLIADLREMLDRQAIWQVLQRYARGLDRMDKSLLLSVYWPDATEDHSHFVGTPEQFADYTDKVTLKFETCQHGLLNHSCDLQGDDAYTETYYIFSGKLAKPPHFLSTGRYIDHFQRRNGEWRIANRVTVVEANYDLADSTMTAGQPSAYGPGEINPATRDRSDISYHRPPVPRRPKA